MALIVRPEGLTALLGGVRSGKSRLAVELGLVFDGSVTLIATAEPFDEEMRDRIESHQMSRPGHWNVVEEPVELLKVIDELDDRDMVIVDCLTVWLGNLLHRGVEHDGIIESAGAIIRGLSGRGGPGVVISNEVGLGVHPETLLGRVYRDILGEVNCCVAAGVDRTLFLLAGRAVPLERLQVEGLDQEMAKQRAVREFDEEVDESQ